MQTLYTAAPVIVTMTSTGYFYHFTSWCFHGRCLLAR